jgi:hypothetical protein
MVHKITSGFKTISAGRGQVRTTRQQILAVRNNAASDTLLFCLVFNSKKH